MLASKLGDKTYTYVGYSNNIKKRLLLHNTCRGAKYTKGKKWFLIYKEIYSNKSKAMSREYKLKKDRKSRNILKNKWINKCYMQNSGKSNI